MSQQKSYDIAVIFPQLYSFLNDVLEGILSVRGIRHHCHFRIFICKDFNVPIEFPKGYRPDGVLSSYDDDGYKAKWLSHLGVPVVNLFASQKLRHSSVAATQESIATMAVNHFETLGYQQIGLLYTRGIDASEPLDSAFEQECQRRDIPYWSLPVPDGIPAGEWWKLDKAKPELRKKLSDAQQRTGIFTTHDTRGRLLADFCTDLRIPVPDKIGILARFDSINARLCTPELSSIVIPSKRIGHAAIQLLAKLIENPNTESEHIRFEVDEIRVRESTVGKDNPDMLVLDARQLIREKSCEGITVDELTQGLPIVRSTFEKRYRALTGMSPAREIRKIRESTARELLLTTNQSIKAVAQNIGFTDPRPFVVFFKREVGMTPGEFRKENGV